MRRTQTQARKRTVAAVPASEARLDSYDRSYLGRTNRIIARIEKLNIERTPR